MRGTINRDVQFLLPLLRDHRGETTHADLELALLVESGSWPVCVRQVRAHPLDLFLESSQAELESGFHVLPKAVGQDESLGLNVLIHREGALKSYSDVSSQCTSARMDKIRFFDSL